MQYVIYFVNDNMYFGSLSNVLEWTDALDKAFVFETLSKAEEVAKNINKRYYYEIEIRELVKEVTLSIKSLHKITHISLSAVIYKTNKLSTHYTFYLPCDNLSEEKIKQNILECLNPHI